MELFPGTARPLWDGAICRTVLVVILICHSHEMALVLPSLSLSETPLDIVLLLLSLFCACSTAWPLSMSFQNALYKPLIVGDNLTL